VIPREDLKRTESASRRPSRGIEAALRVGERDDQLDRMSLGERGGSDVVTDPESLRVGR